MSSFNPFELEGKRIWVIGGAGYLGQAIVRLLLQCRANVLCCDLSGRAGIFADQLGAPENLSTSDIDIADIGATNRFVEEHVERNGVPDGLVNLTAFSTALPMEELSEEDFDRVNHGGLTATFMLARSVGALMAREGKGSVVLFSSMYGMVSPNPDAYKAPMNKNPVEYGVGKAGIIQMVRYLAVHWGPQKVRFNCISPGPFPNPEVQKQHPLFIERLSGKSPMHRIGQAPEIAGAVVFLLSDAASYITGHNLVVDGGWTSW